MTPIDAAMREVAIELDQLARRIGNGQMPEAIEVKITFDRSTGMPRSVELEEHRKRQVLGAQIDQRRRIA